MKAMRLTGILLFIVFLVTGCATLYRPAEGSFTGGYSDSKIQKDMYNVSFEANGFTSHERAMNFLLYRCAEITIQNGYDHFVVASENSATIYAVVGKSSTVAKPNLSVRIKLRSGAAPADNANAYNARELMTNLESKIER